MTEATREFIVHWLSYILDNRADKSWVPTLHAPPDVAKYLGEVAGIKVQANDKIMPHTLQVMGEGEDAEGIRYVNKMARYEGIVVPAESK